MWKALPGFGGTGLMYPVLLTLGLRRRVALERIVDLAAANPARAYGLAPRKGAIAIGSERPRGSVRWWSS